MPDADFRPMTENWAYFQSDACTVSKTEPVKCSAFLAEDVKPPNEHIQE